MTIIHNTTTIRAFSRAPENNKAKRTRSNNINHTIKISNIKLIFENMFNRKQTIEECKYATELAQAET